MSKKNLPGSKTCNEAKPESEARPSNAQLLSVIEFSRQFPELTLHLATVPHGDEEKNQVISQGSTCELLEFPPLLAPDPREIKPRLPEADSGGAPSNDASDDEFALFAAGRLPPPEPARSQDEQKKKKKFWKLLLPLTLLLLVLCWLHEVGIQINPLNAAQQHIAEAMPPE